MRKRFPAFLIGGITLVFAFALLISPITSHVLAQSEQYTRLVTAAFRNDKGAVFTFKYKGYFDLNSGMAIISGRELPLTCHFVAKRGNDKKNRNLAGSVLCTANISRKLAIGAQAQVSINGSSWNVTIK